LHALGPPFGAEIKSFCLLVGFALDVLIPFGAEMKFISMALSKTISTSGSSYLI
jgi:hypothetical protein